jgi:hypothetical protein
MFPKNFKSEFLLQDQSLFHVAQVNDHLYLSSRPPHQHDCSPTIRNLTRIGSRTFPLAPLRERALRFRKAVHAGVVSDPIIFREGHRLDYRFSRGIRGGCDNTGGKRQNFGDKTTRFLSGRSA